MGNLATPDQIRATLRQVDTRRAAGATITNACRVAGISPSTYRRWQKLVAAPVSKTLSDTGVALKPRATQRPVSEAAPRHVRAAPPQEQPSRMDSLFKWAGRIARAISFTESLNQALQAQVASTIEAVVAHLPDTRELERNDAGIRCDAIIHAAAAKAAAAAGGLALPLGPLAILFILPDLMVVWKIQAQMVADIAGVFGKRQTLTREQMLYCLFKHAAGRTVRSVAVRTGRQVLVKAGSLHLLRRLISRLSLPVIGAFAGGVYAYYDTAQVGKTAVESFRSEKGQTAGKRRV